MFLLISILIFNKRSFAIELWRLNSFTTPLSCSKHFPRGEFKFQLIKIQFPAGKVLLLTYKVNPSQFFEHSSPVFSFVMKFSEIHNPKTKFTVENYSLISLFFNSQYIFLCLWHFFLNSVQKSSIWSVSNISPAGNPIFNSCSSNLTWWKCFSSF